MKTIRESDSGKSDAAHLAARLLEIAVRLAGASHAALLRLDRASNALHVVQTHGSQWLRGNVSLNASPAGPAGGAAGATERAARIPSRVLCGAWNMHGGIAMQVAESALPPTIGFSFAVPVMTDGQMGGLVTLHSAAELRCDNRVVSAISDLARLGVDIFAVHEREQARDAATDDESKHAARLALLGESMASVMHEINNPLTAVMGFASLAQHASPAANDENRQALKAIVSEAHRAAAIVRDVLNFSRKIDREPRERIDLNHLLDQVAMLRRISHRQLGINFAIVRSPEPALVEGRAAQLLQIVLNLVVNAEQAIGHRANGVITLRVEAIPGHWHVLVADNGPGIPAEVNARLFEPFFTTKPAGKGSGLGLSTSRAIATEHGGELRLVATSHSGTVFLLALPRMPAAGSGVASLARDRASGAPLGAVPGEPRVLVVDEDPAICAVVEVALRTWSVRVDTARDGLTALRLVQERDYDFVLSAASLPGSMDGWKLGETLGELLPRYRPRFGCLLASPVERPLRDDVPSLAKPFTAERLAQFVRECLARAERSPATSATTAAKAGET